MTNAIPASDNAARHFPISIKAVLLIEGEVALLRNEREEWELPGGKLETGEAPRICLAREVEEELAIPVIVATILDSWLYAIRPGLEVLIVTYLCLPAGGEITPRLSEEHRELGLFTYRQIESLRMPAGYKASIARARLLLG